MSDDTVVSPTRPGRFPRIASIVGVTPPWRSRQDGERFMDIVRAADIARVDADRHAIASAEAVAARIVREAHREAAAHVRQLEESAALERENWFVERGRLFDARASDALAAIPRTVMAIVKAVLGAAAEAQPDLALRASVDIAVRVLQAEMRRQVLCHPLDLPALQGLAPRLEATSVEPHASIDRGDLAFVVSQGEVRVSGTRAMQALAEDLRAVLSSVLPSGSGGSASAPS